MDVAEESQSRETYVGQRSQEVRVLSHDHE
jgi:hypothetical protein